MNLNKVIIAFIVSSSLSLGAYSVEDTAEVAPAKETKPDLEKELDSLNLDINQGPGSATLEKLYSVQTRLSPLSKRHEISLDMGKNLNAGGHTNSQQVGLSYRYHLNDRFSFGLAGKKVFNELSTEGEYILEKQRLVLAKDYAKSQIEAFSSLNVFYGKFRLGLNRVFYFDQYIALGAGMVSLSSGSSPMLSPDIGLALWLGKNASVRLGVRNEFYNEKTLDGEEMNHNVVAHFDVGYLFGGK